MVRKVAHGGSTPEHAAEKAQAAAERVLARDVDRQPCPNCGRYQPDMIAGGRKTLHGWMLFVAVLALGLFAALAVGDVIQSYQALELAMGLVAVLAALGFLVDFGDPNRDLAANRRTAEQQIAAQRVRLLQAGTGTGTVFQNGHSDFLPWSP